MSHSPDFFLVGAPKCGTTALHTFLAEHPEIFMPERKEIHYYGSDLSGLASQLTPAEHATLFAGADGHARVGETCIWALYSDLAAQEIRCAVPQAQIVIMLRDPVDMVHALHSEFVYWRTEDIGDFARAMRAEEKRKRGRALPSSREPLRLLFYRDVARYAEQVERYFREFGRDRVHVILFEDLQDDLPGVYGRLLDFLGVDAAFRPRFRLINPSRRVRSTHLRRWLDDETRASRRLLRALVTSADLRDRVRGTIERWNVGPGPRRAISSRLRGRLRKEFAPDVRRLAVLLDRDLSRWLP